ncbi:inositol monophosphatase family protein [Metarhizium robertsii]|uniref:Inositol-1-monophosphatase n=2 Tax=Metarhizium robertsii TaxID=568076 RepID=E9F6P1_METRA|nr:Inositol monophosphatase, metal-binding site [Metarhizium robertsii ARSEF 23]EFY96657.1 Inositol monophosphatase, metal-binding site [Metarhizium robertsii ARSEF 23]EXU98981.1 inositol monophosphatase family protein [Metarhizium robertsii]
MDDHQLTEIYAFAKKLGKDAGQMLLDSAWSRIKTPSSDGNFQEKESSVDIVTKTDHAVEEFIRQSIITRFPDHSFLGEESYSAGSSKEYLVTSAPTWIVDPLDGTVNFTHLFPMFCVSIAFCTGGHPVIGVINAPFLNQFFSSCRGKGAWFNEQHQLPLVRNPIPPLPEAAPSGCTFACEWGKDRREGPDGNLNRKVNSFLKMAMERKGRGGRGGMVHGVRSLGSATMDLAYTAMGSIDIWWEGGCWEWDVAAGIAILEEAGGLVTTANPPRDYTQAAIPQVKLGGRLYLAIRPAGSSDTETALEAQHRVVRQVWQRVEALNYDRPQ